MNNLPVRLAVATVGCVQCVRITHCRTNDVESQCSRAVPIDTRRCGFLAYSKHKTHHVVRKSVERTISVDLTLRLSTLGSAISS